MSTPLNSLIALHDYKKRFHQLHAALKNGLLAGIELGRELNKFIPLGLWKQEADTEETFFQKNFPDWTPRYIRRLREAAKYTDALQFIVDRTGEPVKIPETVEEAIESKRKEKSKVASKEDLPSDQNNTEEEHKTTSSPKQPVTPVDATGYPVHHTLIPLWERRDELTPLATQISELKCFIEKKWKEDDEVFMEIHNDLAVKLHTAYYYITSAKLTHVCGFCQGKCKILEQTCPHCRNTGLMTKETWDRIVTAELKALRQKSIKT